MRLAGLFRSISIHILIRTAAVALPLFFAAVAAGTLAAPQLHAQSVLAGDIAGTVTDPSGAAIPGVQVEITSQGTGAKATTVTSGTGAYRFSLLQPGMYKLTASKNGFKGASTTVTVGIGQITTQNMQLALGQASETIEVTAAPQLLQTDTAQLSTHVNMEQLQNIPNPGSDITYAAQSRPGVIMNTGANSSSGTLGYGNFSAFGLPGTSNNFTINGMQVNDPFLNLNNSGPSNLLLGINDVQETDVITNAYEVQYGGFGGVQLNSISRSGTDHFHGNLVYAWNGRAMNANNWFNKNSIINTPTIPRPFSNFNQWAASLGGPIKRQRFFFFANTEGISFITSSQAITLLPSPAYEASVVGSGGATCSGGSLAAAGAASQCAFYNHIFALYNGTPNYASASPVTGGNGLNLQLSTPARLDLTEKLVTGRFDANLTDHDKLFVHFKWDHGVQPTYTDPINPAFNAQSDQPDYEGQMAWTHTFGARAVNQFLVTGSWYSAIFKYVNSDLALSTFPMEMTWLDGFASDLNNDGRLWPQGRNVTQYQVGDDFSLTRGTETFKAGFQFKKDYISDHDTGILTTPFVFVDATTFATGLSDGGNQNFTNNLNLPLQLYTLGAYVEDDWKPSPKATITAGVRVERNSNVSCSVNCLSNFGGDFFPLAATSPLNNANLPYNSQFRFNLSQAFTNYQAYMVEPRVGFTASVTPRTVFRGGFGIFTDVFPGTIADTMLDNPPLTRSFLIQTNSAGTPVMALQPTNTTSFQSLAAGADITFVSQFAAGSATTPCPVAGNGSLGSANCMTAANPNFSVPSFTTVQNKIHYPTYMEWNLQLQRQFSTSDSIQIGYVGNRGYHEPNQNVGVNASGTPVFPAISPAPSFGSVTQVESNAMSNFNGLIASWVHQGHGLTAQFNYEFAHALDQISNGGILPFNAASINYQIDPSRLANQYGNADYDVRHYFSGNYLYAIPHYGGPEALTANWSIGGTIFWNSGNPFTPSQFIKDFGVSNFGNGINVTQIAPLPGASVSHHCGRPSPTNPNLACLNPADFAAFSNPTPGVSTGVPFGAYGRNQFFGSYFLNTDLTILKGFHLPHLGEQTKFEGGATAFNLINHPNFGLPNSNIDAAKFAQSTYLEGPPTSIYGSGLGGDPSIRIIELNGRIVF